MNRRAELIDEKQRMNEMLQLIPAESVLERLGPSMRIQEIDEEILGLSTIREPARLAITYEGNPVIGSKAIDANFVNKALGDFLELIGSFKASSVGETGERGPLGGGMGKPLYMTGIVLGSFGFEFEQYVEDQLPINIPSEIEGIIERIEGTFNALRDDEEGVATEISNLDKRVIDDIRALVNTLGSNKATMNIRLNDKDFKLDENDIATLKEIIKEENISEESVTISGVLNGVLPETRRFEFLLNNDVIITGKIEKSIENPEELNLKVLQKVNAIFRVVKVGKARPKYILQEIRPVDEELKFGLSKD